ncbi:MAG: NnrS family protein [Nitrospirae bacterium]|nr:NnrS family protein [Magnetococcales bacterium]HAT51025.1 hypothetical protein [Alphaproteobacteria bacterium]
MKLFDNIFNPKQSFSPMNYTRRPILHHFWAGGLVAMVLGFSLGFLLWMMQTGIMDVAEGYQSFRLWHVRIQILGFAGSFLLGFALQAGPHVVGGTPPPFRHVIPHVPILWIGLLLSSITTSATMVTVGNACITLAFVGPVVLLLKITLNGDPQLRFARGIPLVIAFLVLAAAPWLDLANSETALFVLWCGPITAALVAGQQLIHNVLHGKKLSGKLGLTLFILLCLAWLTTAMATFAHLWPWSIPGLAWLVSLSMVIWGTQFIPAIKQFGFAAISLTLSTGFLGIAVTAIMMLGWPEGIPVDSMVHLLGAGVITVLILGIVSRVTGFFSGGAVFSDAAVSGAILIWSAIATFRVITSMSSHVNDGLVIISVGLGGTLLTLWGIRVAWRLRTISQAPYPGKNGA